MDQERFATITRRAVGVVLAVAIPLALAPPPAVGAVRWQDDVIDTLLRLRVDIADVATVPPELQPAFLAQVDAVEGLLLPAIQSGREAQRKACAAVRILTALRHEAETAAASGTFNGDNFEIVIADIDVLLRFITADREPPRRC